MLYPNGQITPAACINLLVSKICQTLLHLVFLKYTQCGRSRTRGTWLPIRCFNKQSRLNQPVPFLNLNFF